MRSRRGMPATSFSSSRGDEWMRRKRSGSPIRRSSKSSESSGLARRERLSGRLLFWRWNQPAEATMGKHEERRLHHLRQDREDERPPNDHDRKRFLRLSADSVGEGSRKQTEH